MVVRASHHGSGTSVVFAALVSSEEDSLSRPGSRDRLVTLRPADTDAASRIRAGDHIDLWLGSNVGEGVVTRRLFT